jgi:sarcosine oxidase subunit gamma
MSNPLSPLNQARFEGVVTIAEAPPQGMITLRGAPEAFSKAIPAVPQARQIVAVPEGAVGWMSPDELLMLCDYGTADAQVAQIEGAMGDAHHLAVNVSDARAMFTLTGAEADLRATLSKLTPADLRPSRLPVGELRRTRLAQVPAAFWFEAPGTVHVICFRSVAQYVFDLLKTAADPLAKLDAG